MHKHFLALGNKHVVHDENAWLQPLTGAVVAGPVKGYNIEKVLCASFQGQTLNDGNFGNLYLPIEHPLAWLEFRFDTLCDDITEQLEKPPREMLLSRPDLTRLRKLRTLTRHVRMASCQGRAVGQYVARPARPCFLDGCYFRVAVELRRR